MLTEIGLFALFFSFIAAIYAIGAIVIGERQKNEMLVLSGRNAALLNFGLLALSCGILMLLILGQEYQVQYVWSVSSPDMPLFFRFTSLWGSQAGSLLFWSFLMSGFSAAAIWLNWKTHRRLMGYATAYMMVVVLFFVGLNLFLENPFNRWWIVPNQQPQVVAAALIPTGAIAPGSVELANSAQGLNPLLRHFGMAIHPPMLYLGFVGFIVPFAFAMSALASGDLSTNWIKASRRWTLAAWLFLGLGLILGGRWAYDVLGWGGYWGWDPVENAAFLPWLIGTAFIHSVMIQEKRGMLKTWNMFLAVGTFSAVIFGTFATRSGLVESVHSFARSGIGFPMFMFWFLVTLVSVWLILWRRGRGELRDEHQFTNILSRESLFVLNNFIFVALFIAIFWGSFGAPILSEIFANTKITISTEYFMGVTPPLFLMMYILMGVAPLSAWGATSVKRLGRAILIPIVLTIISLGLFLNQAVQGGNLGALIGYGVVLLSGWVAIYETYRGTIARMKAHGEQLPAAFMTLMRRNPRRYGGYLIHLGVTVIGIGIIGSTLFQDETTQTLAVGETLVIQDYQLRYDGLLEGQITQDGRIMDIAEVTVIRNGEEIAHLRPRRDFFPNMPADALNSMTIAGSHSTLENDFYVLLVSWETISANSATFKVYINPLVNLVWWGGLIFIAGTIFSFFPKETLPERIRQRMQQAESLGLKGAKA